MTRTIIVDFEASGLNQDSWPVEIGWAVIGDYCVLDSGSTIVRPELDWNHKGWDPEAEKLHGMSLASIVREGMSAADAWHTFHAKLDGVDTIFCDAPMYDRFWCRRLARAAKCEDEMPALQHFCTLFHDMSAALRAWTKECRNSKKHRAQADAEQLARFCLQFRGK